MSEHCSSRPFPILLIFLVAIASPLVSAEPVESSTNVVNEFTPVFANIDDFEPLDSHPYMLPDSEEKLYSATRMMKNEWNKIFVRNHTWKQRKCIPKYLGPTHLVHSR